jgi:urea carboxylase-associated protein 1
MPAILPLITKQELSMNALLSGYQCLVDEICPAGEPWMGRLQQGQSLVIVDLEGNQAVDTLFFNASDVSERYSVTDTIASNQQLYLSTGSVLYSNLGRPMAQISEDNCGRHDTLGGACSCESNSVRYAHETYPMHSCRNNFLYAIATHPLALQHQMTVRHLGPNINFFMNVPVSAAGALSFADGISAAGKYVVIQAQMDLIVLISNCPQLNNPCNAYHPTPIQVLVYADQEASDV